MRWLGLCEQASNLDTLGNLDILQAPQANNRDSSDKLGNLDILQATTSQSHMLHCSIILVLHMVRAYDSFRLPPLP